MDEGCDLDPQVYEQSTALFSSWKDWADKAGEFAGSSKKLSQSLENRGFARVRRSTGTCFLGIKIRPLTTWKNDE